MLLHSSYGMPRNLVKPVGKSLARTWQDLDKSLTRPWQVPCQVRWQVLRKTLSSPLASPWQDLDNLLVAEGFCLRGQCLHGNGCSRHDSRTLQQPSVLTAVMRERATLSSAAHVHLLPQSQGQGLKQGSSRGANRAIESCRCDGAAAGGRCRFGSRLW